MCQVMQSVGSGKEKERDKGEKEGERKKGRRGRRRTISSSDLQRSLGGPA